MCIDRIMCGEQEPALFRGQLITTAPRPSVAQNTKAAAIDIGYRNADVGLVANLMARPISMYGFGEAQSACQDSQSSREDLE